MRRVHTGPVTGFVCELALLGALAATVGLSASAWLVGVGCGVGTNVALARGMARHQVPRLGPADWVTMARAALAGGVAALVVESFSGPAPVATVVTLSAVGLVLDSLDGWVARRTHTVSGLGARFDMEVDAFLILVLSVYVARTTGWWVLAIGSARYLFVAAGWLLPWLRGSVPARQWCKVVAAVQGVVLTVAAAEVLPVGLTIGVLAVALILLSESFGREAWQLWRSRPGSRAGPVELTGAAVVRDG